MAVGIKRPINTLCHFGDDFYRPDDQTNSVKVLTVTSWSTVRQSNNLRRWALKG